MIRYSDTDPKYTGLLKDVNKMHDLSQIIAVVERYYPSREEYTYEKYPGNGNLPALVDLCKRTMESHPDWEAELDELRRARPQLLITDYSLLIGNEPSFHFVSQVLGQSNVLYAVSISVMVPLYLVHRLSNMTDAGFERELHTFISGHFPGYSELSEDESRTLAPSVMVPAHEWFIDEGKSPTIADCIFGVRALPTRASE